MKLFRNTFWLSVSFLVSRGMSIVWNTYLARTFASQLEELGVYLFIMAQFALFSILAEGNISYTFQHFISKEALTREESAKKYWAFSFYAKVVLGIIFGLVLYFIVVEQYPNSSFSAFLVAVSLLIFNIGAAPLGILIAHNQFKVQIISYLINSLVFTISAMIAVMLTKNINIIFSVLIFANLVASIYTLRKGIVLYGFPIRNIGMWELSKKILSFSIPLLIASFCFTFFYRLDINIIAKKMPAQYVTYISLALMFFFLIVDFLWSQLASAMTPDLLRNWTEGEIAKNNAINQLLILLSVYSVLSCFMGVGLKIFGDFLFKLLLGKKGDFQNILPILYYLLMGLPFIVSYAFLYRLYLLNNTSTKFMIYSLLFLAIKFILFYLLVDALNFHLLTILSGGILVIVYLCFIFFMKELKKFRKIMMWNFLKVFVTMLLLAIYIFLFPAREISFPMIFSGIAMSFLVILIFWETLKPQLFRLKYLKR